MAGVDSLKAFAAEQGGMSVSVADMAKRREDRAREQAQIIKDGCCAVCIGLNIAGPIKRGAPGDALFAFTVSELFEKLRECEKFEIGKIRFINEKTGAEALVPVRGDAQKIKALCMECEEKSTAGRLLDIDVIMPDGRKVGRLEPRKCLICGENASICARSRAHSVDMLQKRTRTILIDALAEKAARLAWLALVNEVHVTPKPGLVDEANNGANDDMDVALFERSAEAIMPFFKALALNVAEFCCRENDYYNNEEIPDNALAEKLRRIGIEAERAMLASTGGVNTHRGAIYSMGLLVCAYTMLVCEGVFGAGEEFTKRCTIKAAALARSLGDGTDEGSNGARMRKKYGVGGAVEQASLGFPLAVLAKSVKTEYDKKGESVKKLSLSLALIAIMAELDDNNALKRGGMEGAEFVKRRARTIMEKAKRVDEEELLQELEVFDEELIERNISCGGAADLLAAAIFLESAERELLMTDALLGIKN